MQKRFMGWVLAGAFILGVSGATDVRAEDPTWGTVGFQPETQDSSVPLLFAKATRKKVANDDSSTEAKVAVGSGFWASVYAGYDFANLGALGSDIKGLVNAAKGFGDNSTLGVANSGILAGVKFGYTLDSTSSFYISGENTWTGESGLNITSGPDTGSFFKYDPTLLGITLNYELTLLNGHGNKTSIVVGGGYYHGSVHYQTDFGEGTGSTIVGDFGQDNIGGTLGVDEELSLGGSLALEITARFRAVDFNKLTSNSYTINGTSQPGGPFVLVSDPIGSNYSIELPAPTSFTLPPPLKDTDMDYTGFNGNVALKLYL